MDVIGTNKTTFSYRIRNQWTYRVSLWTGHVSVPVAVLDEMIEAQKSLKTVKVKK